MDSKEQKRGDKRVQTSQLLLICGALILSALVYIFISLQRNLGVDAASLTPSLSPTPVRSATPSPTPIVGVKESVFLKQFENTALLLAATEEPYQYRICIPYETESAEAYEGLLEITLRSGYVRGFLLQVPAYKPPSSKRSLAPGIEEGMARGESFLYEKRMETQRQLIHLLLRTFLALVDTQNEVPAALLPLWEAGAEEAQRTGEPFSEASGDFLFSAVTTESGLLMVSLSR